MKLLTIDDAKPCPFCGEKEVQFVLQESPWLGSDRSTKFEAGAYCPECPFEVEMELWAEGREEATDMFVRDWNRRARVLSVQQAAIKENCTMTDYELNPCMDCGGTDCVIEADITRRIDGSIYVVMASARCRDCKSVGLGKHKNEKKAIQLAVQAWSGERPRYWFSKREEELEDDKD